MTKPNAVAANGESLSVSRSTIVLALKNANLKADYRSLFSYYYTVSCSIQGYTKTLAFEPGCPQKVHRDSVNQQGQP